MEPAKQTTLPPNHLFTGVTPSTPSPVTQQPGSPTAPYVPPVSVTGLKKEMLFTSMLFN